MKHLLPLLALALALTARPTAAQTTTLAPPGTETAAPAAAPTAAHLQAAAALLNSIYTEESFNRLIEQMLQSQLQSQPSMKPYASEFRAFFQKYMSWSVVRPKLVDLYAREFTQPELEELARFYQSPVGRKASEKLPVLMRSGMEIGQKTVQEHLPELTKAIEAKAKMERSEH